MIGSIVTQTAPLWGEAEIPSKNSLSLKTRRMAPPAGRAREPTENLGDCHIGQHVATLYLVSFSTGNIGNEPFGMAPWGKNIMPSVPDADRSADVRNLKTPLVDHRGTVIDPPVNPIAPDSAASFHPPRRILSEPSAHLRDIRSRYVVSVRDSWLATINVVERLSTDVLDKRAIGRLSSRALLNSAILPGDIPWNQSSPGAP
jgi:hypothetical protein